ncbi:MAG: AAA family ATPase [Candidatus Poribacteria bacterium]|nr:AAA family ATPase [Candidatus Poribacteria bacterium]
MKNPYLNRMAITTPSEFYGRMRELRRIFSRLSATRPQCLSIIGERKIGKSSLLHFIAHEQNTRRYLETSEKFIFVLVDLQGKADLHPEGFFDMLFRGIHAKTDALPSPTNGQDNFYESFRRLIQTLGGQEIKLILLLDEFESMGRNEAFDLAFFSFLRSIANNNDVAYVTTSRQDLQQVSQHQHVRESPFFNIFTPIPLGGFQDAEAIQLIQEPSAEAGIPLGEQETEFILDLAGNYPFFLQIACDKVFDKKSQTGKLAQKDYDTIRSTFFSEANDHFDYIWEHATPDERDVFLQIVQQEGVEPAKRYVLAALEKKGYLVRADERHFLFSSGFEDYVWRKSPRADEKKPPSGRGKNRVPVSSQTTMFGKLKNLFRRS